MVAAVAFTISEAIIEEEEVPVFRNHAEPNRSTVKKRVVVPDDIADSLHGVCTTPSGHNNEQSDDDDFDIFDELC